MRMLMKKAVLSWRETVTPSDEKLVRRLCKEAGNFSASEVELAVELVLERLNRGVGSGYHFLFAQLSDNPVGYACYGAIPCTESAWDLYWLVVDKAFQGNGLGEKMMGRVEQLIWQSGGRRVYVDTSGRPAYEATRCFYEKCGYMITARLPGFYAEGDAKIIYCKELA